MPIIAILVPLINTYGYDRYMNGAHLSSKKNKVVWLRSKVLPFISVHSTKIPHEGNAWRAEYMTPVIQSVFYDRFSEPLAYVLFSNPIGFYFDCVLKTRFLFSV